ncbi:MAG: SUMF1/EgtB/PvdO family nonheme iron enzyme, partial [Myxococcales bacterium]|nr:SUMF1/EgtB/PvdO family nonheme iron enzyme [Myxococcales bacterium]
AWDAVAARAQGTLAEEATVRARQWHEVSEAEARRRVAAWAAWRQYERDRATLQKVLGYSDAVVPAAQKKAWQDEFDRAYAPWRDDFARLVGDVDWVRVPAGAVELPESRLPIGRLLVGRTEVTQAQYAACVRAGACTAPQWRGCQAGPGLATPLDAHFAAPDQPVVCVDRFQAEAFARYVGGRLPSPAEWLHAARGGEARDGYPWGGGPADCQHAALANAEGYGCGRRTTVPVCTLPAGRSKQGLCDAVGNVAEWTAETVAGPGGRPRATIIGGSVVHATVEPSDLQRDLLAPAQRAAYVGFRVVRDAP